MQSSSLLEVSIFPSTDVQLVLNWCFMLDRQATVTAPTQKMLSNKRDLPSVLEAD